MVRLLPPNVAIELFYTRLHYAKLTRGPHGLGEATMAWLQCQVPPCSRSGLFARPERPGYGLPMPDVKYDKHYRDAPAACGPPFTEFAAFCHEAPTGSVLDLGCGQGRDALMFAREGHRVVGVDVSSVGVIQMLATARSEGLDVEGVVQDIRTYRPDTTFDIVILDRVLHMLDADDRLSMLASAMRAVAPGGHLLVAEGPKGLKPVREAMDLEGWSLPKATRNRVIARRPTT